MPARSLIASIACIVPITPTSGAKTPIVAQRSSSPRASAGKRQW